MNPLLILAVIAALLAVVVVIAYPTAALWASGDIVAERREHPGASPWLWRASGVGWFAACLVALALWGPQVLLAVEPSAPALQVTTVSCPTGSVSATVQGPRVDCLDRAGHRIGGTG